MNQQQRRTRLPAAERRETILRAATEVFARAGYRAAKVSEVADRIGVTEPVVFQNFGSKAALFAAVLERAAAEIRASLDDLADGSDAASGLLARILTQPTGGPPDGGTPAQHAAHAAHAGAAYGVLFADAATLAADPDLAGPARDAVRAVAAHLTDLVRSAQGAGDISPDADPAAAGWLLLSVLSTRRLRAVAMPAELEPAIGVLALRALGHPAGRDWAPGGPTAAADSAGRPGSLLRWPSARHCPATLVLVTRSWRRAGRARSRPGRSGARQPARPAVSWRPATTGR